MTNDEIGTRVFVLRAQGFPSHSCLVIKSFSHALACTRVPAGAVSLHRLTTPGRISKTASISARVVYRERLKRTEENACSMGRPRARSTWDGSIDPDAQADPVEQAMPARSRLITRLSESAPSNRRFEVLEILKVRLPLSVTSGIRRYTSCSK